MVQGHEELETRAVVTDLGNSELLDVGVVEAFNADKRKVGEANLEKLKTIIQARRGIERLQ